MKFTLSRRLLPFTLTAALVLGSASLVEAANDKRALRKFAGTYKGAWKAAGNLPLTLRMPKGKGTGEGSFDATPCAAGNNQSPLKIRVKNFKVRRNGKKLISKGTAVWKRGDVAALKGANLQGKLKVVAVLRGRKPSASGKMTTGTLGGGLDIKKPGTLPAPVCVEKAFALPGDPADIAIADDTTTFFTLNVPNSVAVISDLDVAISIGGPNNVLVPFNEDYTVTLRHLPSGVEVELFSEIGFDDDGIFVRLDDEASDDIGDVPNDSEDFPVIGVYNPEGAATLAAFNGVLASGTWELEILDDNGGLTGRLLNWTLHIE